jgi:hypothetical protein
MCEGNSRPGNNREKKMYKYLGKLLFETHSLHKDTKTQEILPMAPTVKNSENAIVTSHPIYSKKTYEKIIGVEIQTKEDLPPQKLKIMPKNKLKKDCNVSEN